LPKGAVDVSNYKPSEADVQNVRKFLKYATSSLDYDDFPAAVKFLKQSVAALTGQPI
jgi:hypothetical protein